MLIKITEPGALGEIINRRLARHYSSYCGSTTCPSRQPYPIRYLRHLAVHSFLQILTLIASSMLISAVGTLFLTSVYGQPTPIAERLAVIESQERMGQSDTVRLLAEIDILRTEIASEREKRAELDSRLSTLQGVGIGLGSIVMVLQAASMLMGIKRKQTT